MARREPWISSILRASFDEEHGQQLCDEFPPASLSKQTLNAIKLLSMPDCLCSSEELQYQYTFNITDGDDADDGRGTGLFGYVLFEQKHSPSRRGRGFLQSSLILVSTLPCPYPELFFRLLHRLHDALTNDFTAPITQTTSADECAYSAGEHTNDELHTCSNGSSGDCSSSSSSNSNSSGQSSFQLLVQVALAQVEQWPAHSAVHKLPRLCGDAPQDAYLPFMLPFFGSIVRFSCPRRVTAVSGLPWLDIDIGAGVDGLIARTHWPYTDIPLLRSLASSGLLSSLWTLLDIVLTGGSVLVYSQSPQTCSTLVCVLASLVPFGFAGSVLPYVTGQYASLVCSNLRLAGSRAHSNLVPGPIESQPLESASSTTRYRPSTSLTKADADEATVATELMEMRSCAASSRAQWDNSSTRTGHEGGGGGGLQGRPGAGGGAGGGGDEDSVDGAFGSLLLGTTNPRLLRDFRSVDAALFVPSNAPCNPLRPRLLSGAQPRTHIPVAYTENVGPLGSMEDSYDRWVAAGATETRICVRRAACLQPDETLLRRMLLTAGDIQRLCGLDGSYSGDEQEEQGYDLPHAQVLRRERALEVQVRDHVLMLSAAVLALCGPLVAPKEVFLDESAKAVMVQVQCFWVGCQPASLLRVPQLTRVVLDNFAVSQNLSRWPAVVIHSLRVTFLALFLRGSHAWWLLERSRTKVSLGMLQSAIRLYQDIRTDALLELFALAVTSASAKMTSANSSVSLNSTSSGRVGVRATAGVGAVADRQSRADTKARVAAKPASPLSLSRAHLQHLQAGLEDAKQAFRSYYEAHPTAGLDEEGELADVHRCLDRHISAVGNVLKMDFTRLVIDKG